MSQVAVSPRRVSDLGDFDRPQELREALTWDGGEVQSSPDGQHLLLLHRGRRLLQAHDRAPEPQGRLIRSWTPLQSPVAGLLFLEGPGHTWVLAVVWENGQLELWGFQAGEMGWVQRQTLELCNSPRARVVSVCCHQQGLAWCEERLPTGATQASTCATTLGYCLCHRYLEHCGPQLTMGTTRIILHHSPQYQLLSTPHHVYLLPTTPSLDFLSKTLLVWSPSEDQVTVVALSIGAIHRKSLLPAESDFKKLMVECLGVMPAIEPWDVGNVAVSTCGSLLLMTKRGDVSLLRPGGTLRHVYDFGGPIGPGELVQMQIFGSTLACVLSGVLYLIDVNIGRLRAKQLLTTNDVLFMPALKEDTIQFLTHTGIYEVSLADIADSLGGVSWPETALVEMVFEEACKYYQQRSLGNATLTVESLKAGGMFQAPIALSSILQAHQNQKSTADLQHRPYNKLLDTISGELESYLSLEHLKACVIGLSESETEQCCDNIVNQEIIRLLNSGLDRENLVYINYLFNTFPQASWKTISRCLQLQQNGVGHSMDKSVSDVWKKVLVPPPSVVQDDELNGVVPLFELICQSLYSYKPKGLAGFVSKAQQYVGVHWNYSTSCEGNPLYKRAMSVLKKRRFDTTTTDDTDIEVELLLCSERPTAIIQAVNLLINCKKWGRVIEVAEKCIGLSPLVHKDIFTSLLIEFSHHRELDPYISKLWEMCPDEMKATDILNIILQHMPRSESSATPLSSDSSGQLTVGLLKPLLNKVLQRQSRPNELYDNSQTPSFPPQTPPREHTTVPKSVTAPAFDSAIQGSKGKNERTNSLPYSFANNIKK